MQGLELARSLIRRVSKTFAERGRGAGDALGEAFGAGRDADGQVQPHQAQRGAVHAPPPWNANATCAPPEQAARCSVMRSALVGVVLIVGCGGGGELVPQQRPGGQVVDAADGAAQVPMQLSAQDAAGATDGGADPVGASEGGGDTAASEAAVDETADAGVDDVLDDAAVDSGADAAAVDAALDAQPEASGPGPAVVCIGGNGTNYSCMSGVWLEYATTLDDGGQPGYCGIGYPPQSVPCVPSKPCFVHGSDFSIEGYCQPE